MTRPNRPRRLLARLATATATLALLGTGALVTAEPAAAASTVWDKVAACESGGRWHINTGNGYYGGLQFSSSTWKAYGGRSYARQASGASKAEQIRVARRVLASQGPGAWPTCGRKAHLTRSNGRATSTTATSSTSRTSRSTSRPALSTSGHKTIKVRSGDTLASIAKRYHVKGGWRGLYKLNHATVKNPNQIRVGQKLRVS